MRFPWKTNSLLPVWAFFDNFTRIYLENLTLNKCPINFVLSAGQRASAGRSRRTFFCKSPCDYAQGGARGHLQQLFWLGLRSCFYS
jgi:hypothetical protein